MDDGWGISDGWDFVMFGASGMEHGLWRCGKGKAHGALWIGGRSTCLGLGARIGVSRSVCRHKHRRP